ncbi:MAG: TolC family protein [Bacteroidota bacterium]
MTNAPQLQHKNNESAIAFTRSSFVCIRYINWFALLLLLLGSRAALWAQVGIQTLTYEAYVSNIYQYHPVAKQAELPLRVAKSVALAARGQLDPLLRADWNEKGFDDKLYYRRYQANLRIPTTLGIDVVGGYENTTGVFLNPENNTDEYGLWSLGVEVNLLQGLITNERRTALQQAAIFQNMARNERQLILNNLIYDAATAYVEWQQYYAFQSVLAENIELAENYRNITRQSFEAGEKTAMDTLEAGLLYQDAVLLAQKNEQVLAKARQQVENYLWVGDKYVELPINTQPQTLESPLFSIAERLSDINLSNHPEILSTLNKLSYLEIEQRLKREKLKPKLKAKYNPLVATSENSLSPNLSLSDYKWGFDFAMPLLLREARAGVQEGQIKLEDTALKLDNKRNELRNKVEASWLQQRSLQQQQQLLSQNVERYRLLLEGEREKLRFGESSIFLLNKRQEKYVDGQLKVIKMASKQQLECLNFLYFSNQLLPQNQ